MVSINRPDQPHISVPKAQTKPKPQFHWKFNSKPKPGLIPNNVDPDFWPIQALLVWESPYPSSGLYFLHLSTFIFERWSVNMVFDCESCEATRRNAESWLFTQIVISPFANRFATCVRPNQNATNGWDWLGSNWARIRNSSFPLKLNLASTQRSSQSKHKKSDPIHPTHF